MDKKNDQPASADAADEKAPPVPEVTDVKLSADESDKITDFINQKALAPKDECPVCGSPQNYVNEYVWRVDTQKTEDALGGRFQPLVSTTCHNCGYVRFFNKIVVEFLMKPKDNGEGGNGD